MKRLLNREIVESAERVFLPAIIIIAVLTLSRLAVQTVVISWAFADSLLRSLIGAIQ